MTTPTVAMTMIPSGATPIDGLTKVVTQIECRFIATNGDDVAVVYEAVPMGSPNPASFKAFDDCTADDFVTWIKAIKGANYDKWVSDMKAAAIAQLSRPARFAGTTLTVPIS